MDDLPAGIAARLRRLEDEEDEEDVEVDHTIPTTWGVDHASSIFRAQSQISRPSSSVSISTDKGPISGLVRRSYAPAFAPAKKRVDPYGLDDHERSFSFASAVRDAPQTSTWDSNDPGIEDQSQNPRKSQRLVGQGSATDNRYGLHDPRNRALEGTFGSTSVKRVVEEGSDTILTNLDPKLEDPNLDIDPNVRANFLTIDQLHRAPAPRSAFALQNPTLIASNRNGPISTVIAGETITYTPKPVDSRVGKLDRHGKYIGKDLGDIPKRLKRQHREDVKERDRQMLQSTVEYRALAAMSAEERAELLERLRKPLDFQGAFEEDQFDEPIPDAFVPRNRVIRWMEDTASQDARPAGNAVVPSGSGYARHHRGDTHNSRTSLSNSGDLDPFAAGSMFIPLSKPDDSARGTSYGPQPQLSPENSVDPFAESSLFVPLNELDDFVEPVSYDPISQPIPRNQEYFKNALHYGRKPPSHLPASERSSSTTNAQIARFCQIRLRSAGSAPLSFTASSRGVDDPFTFDDSPEFQAPEDSTIECEVQLKPEQEKHYQNATKYSQESGRVVQVRLHEPVKFSPGAIARRVFGGVIQEVQLFPTQRIGIVVFLHPREAKAFIRHIKKTYEIGDAQDIRWLQIEAGWYKGSERESILPIQPNIIIHHITSHATRSLRLHRLSAIKTKEEVSAELGARLVMPLLTVILCPAQSHYFGAEKDLGRQAVIEMASISDAIRAKELLANGKIDEYEDCEPRFAGDPCAKPGPEKAYCNCMGCREHRKAREEAKGVSG